ncbi:MAG: 1-acyl-sn-glycerol-3-phosphate acyltransferase [Deltaproteobacteria bacterium]|nr:1-acyl-sn-glycerol-3-phosphate acyltransferase [Deltaproteobacteria bacterium]
MLNLMRNLINATRSAIVIVPNTCFWAISTCLMTFTPWARQGIEFCGNWWGWINLKLNGVEVIYQGLENIDPQQTYMVIANHKSFLDIYAIFSCRALHCLFVAKRELTKIPIFGLALQRSGSIIIDRGNREEAISRLQEQGRILRERQTSIVLFAEGTRMPAAVRLGTFKKGGFILASQLGLSILPLTISNSGNLQPKGKIAIRPGTITLTFSPAIKSPVFHAEGKAEENTTKINELIEQTRKAIDSNL